MTKKAAMDDRTTLDFKRILTDWKHFQNSKLKMANKFQCNMSTHSNGVPYTTPNLLLTFVAEPEPHILFHNALLTIKLPLAELNGYNTQARIIELTIIPERYPGVLRLEFPNEAVHSLALAELEAFTREMSLLLTPSSDSSGSA